MSEFSFEHIWPDALGGGHLSDFWHTTDVCRNCNSMSGVFVDGQFLRGWAGRSERAAGAQEYLSPTNPAHAVLPLDYLGKLNDPCILPHIAEDEVADWWAGPCGAHIVHFRPAEEEDFWTRYAGGDPRAKKSKAGRAYINLVSSEHYWIVAALVSYKKHFERQPRYVVTPGLPLQWTAFLPVNRNDPAQTADLRVMDAIAAAARDGTSIRAQVVVGMDSEHRFLAKLALGIGCKLFGARFGEHSEGALLRTAFRMPDLEKRKGVPIMGAGYFAGTPMSALDVLSWSGAWVLIVQLLDGALALSVVTPSGRRMTIKVTDDSALTASLPQDYRDGVVWITVPTLGVAVGPMPLPDYAAHKMQVVTHAELAAIEAARIDPATLPPC